MVQGKTDTEWHEVSANLHPNTYQPNSDAEKKLVRKIDMHIVCFTTDPTRNCV